jgi:hypothetical protein
VLYGLKAWVAGNYEKGSLVNFKGALYRATANVITADTEPGTVFKAAVPAGPGGVPPAQPEVKAAPWELIPLTAGVHNVPTDSDLPATAPAEDVYLVLNSTKAGSKPGLFSYDPGTTAWVQLGGGDQGKTLDLSAGNELRSVGVPVGSIMMWMFGAPPPGWLLCDGSTFTAAEFPELALMIPGLKLPDLRGAYLRGAGLNGALGWGDAANLPGNHQEDSTAKPKVAFYTNVDGEHSHTYKSGWGSTQGIKGGTFGAGEIGFIGTTNTTNVYGAHYHRVENGGDPETRPKSIFTDFIIKAFDQSVTLVF